MTDIWRSFVAQRIAWANGWSILFHEANVWQERNDHSLMRDFADEVPGYLNNRAMCEKLAALDLKAGRRRDGRKSTDLLSARSSKHGWVGEQELPLLDAWLEDLAKCWR